MVRALLESMECFGLFRELAVTVDVSPLEVQGTLRSGERICFRYRWGLVSLGVYHADKELAGYSFQMDKEVDVPAGECIYLLNQWIMHFAMRAVRLSAPVKEEVFERPPPGMALSWPRTGRRVYPRPPSVPDHATPNEEKCAAPGMALSNPRKYVEVDGGKQHRKCCLLRRTFLCVVIVYVVVSCVEFFSVKV